MLSRYGIYFSSLPDISILASSLFRCTTMNIVLVAVPKSNYVQYTLSVYFFKPVSNRHSPSAPLFWIFFPSRNGFDYSVYLNVWCYEWCYLLMDLIIVHDGFFAHDEPEQTDGNQERSDIQCLPAKRHSEPWISVCFK